MTYPLGILGFVQPETNARKITTDSGGTQKEAYLLKVPCITVRPETEWVEKVEAGWNTLVGFDPGKLKEAIDHFQPSGTQPEIFGEYSCGKKIVKVLAQRFKIG